MSEKPVEGYIPESYIPYPDELTIERLNDSSFSVTNVLGIKVTCATFEELIDLLTKRWKP